MKKTRILSALLAAAMLTATLAACGGSSETTSGTGEGTDNGPAGTNPTETTPGLSGLIEDDEALYDYVLGDFYKAYEAAQSAKTVSEKFALMAIAEAKLMESAVFMPFQANGGNYAVSKVAPYTITSVLWGTDSDRYHNALVATEAIKAEDREALKSLYKEKKGTGTWEASAKAYLADKGYTLQRSYTFAYSSDPATFNLFRSSEAVDSELLVNTYDGLLEYDSENVLQPALATALPTVSEDGLTYTFTIRQGVKWVNSLKEEIGDVTAKDFVTGFHHMLDDGEEGLSWLVNGLIVGVEEYVAGDTEDFDDVGVKAIDDYTLQYTLTAPCSYFTTMFGYGVFAPLLEDYYVAQGGEFGFGNGNAGDYGIDKDHIAYCGPYVITNFTSKNSIVFEKNESYWNKDNINLDKITWLFNDGSISTQAYDDFKNGVIDGCGLNAAALELAKGDGNFEKYGYVSSPDATAFTAFYNMHRRAYANFNDETKMVSAQTAEEQERANYAMQNQNFRLALATGLDRGAYLEQQVGTELKYTSMINSYTPGTFVSLEESVTVKINGTDKTYPAGTFYGQIMQDQIDADGYPMKVFDATADGGIGSSAGYDGWYNVESARKFFADAVTELAAQGLEISAENPIVLDLPYRASSTATAAANAYKQSIESTLEKKVIINLIETDDIYEYYYATYFFNTGAEANYNINTNTGWGPDYGDPSTYLDTMIKGGGYMLKTLGLDC